MSEYNELGNWYVASLVLQVRPEFLTAVKVKLSEMPYTEIHAEKPDEGKLVVVMEADKERVLVNKMESLQTLEGVMAVSLIYSQRDEQPN